MGLISVKEAYFQAASKFYEEALSIYTKERTPGKWAEVSNNYGIVLLALGEQAGAHPPLDSTIKNFRASLGAHRRESVPLLWAQTINNLGTVCFALAKRNSDPALLCECVAYFGGAIELYTKSGETKKLAAIENNLSRVKRLMSVTNKA